MDSRSSGPICAETRASRARPVAHRARTARVARVARIVARIVIARVVVGIVVVGIVAPSRSRAGAAPAPRRSRDRSRVSSSTLARAIGLDARNARDRSRDARDDDRSTRRSIARFELEPRAGDRSRRSKRARSIARVAMRRSRAIARSDPKPTADRRH
jgi:flagellar biosynthesis/type III secretory pathway M-ring protein FliF/YscJ